MFRIRRGDTIVVRAGKNRGKRGTVARLLSARGLVVVDGVNLYKKHVRPKRQGEKGQTVELPRPLRLSAVLPVCAACDRGVRVGYRTEGKAKVRFCRRCRAAV